MLLELREFEEEFMRQQGREQSSMQRKVLRLNGGRQPAKYEGPRSLCEWGAGVM